MYRSTTAHRCAEHGPQRKKNQDTTKQTRAHLLPQLEHLAHNRLQLLRENGVLPLVAQERSCSHQQAAHRLPHPPVTDRNKMICDR